MKCGAFLKEEIVSIIANSIDNKSFICELCREKTRKERSKRMKENNPMKREEVRKKVSKTFKEKIEKGLIEYKYGIDHHLWKGNRGLGADIRSRLYSIWIVKILERDGFKCIRCGKNTDLQVHHIKPLREIILEVIKNEEIPNSNSEEYNILLEKICDQHQLEDGITLCKECHEVEDYFYRPFKGKKK